VSANSSGNQKGSKTQAFPASQLDDVADDESATAILEILRTTPSATIAKAATTTWSASAPAPLITSTLQQEASALFKYNPKSTMSAAQKLYEAGHITYMRTDSAVLSEEAAAQARQLVEAQFGAEYVATTATATAAKKASPKSKKTAAAAAPSEAPQAQEAHEAIRPTHFEVQELPEDTNHMERKLYKLIWQRAVQSVMAAAQGEQRTIQFLPDSEDAADFPWQAKWRRTTFPGWKALGVQAARLDEDSEDTEEESAAATQWQQATSLKAGAQLQWQALHATPKETKAAPRYTEATLVRELERKGIGRPSTFASLIAAIQDKGYVETKDIPGKKRVFNIMHLKPGKAAPSYEPVEKMFGAEKGKLTPTALGRSALAFALQHFEDLFSYNFTAQMEKELDDISKGVAPWKRVLRQTWDSYSERYQALKSAAPATSAPGGSKAPSDRVRDFGKGLKAVLTKKGPLLLQEPPEGSPEGAKPVFYGWPGKKAFHDLTEEEACRFAKAAADKQTAIVVVEREEEDTSADADGVECSVVTPTPKGQIIKKQGKYGWYAECDGVRVTCTEQDTYKDLAVKLAAKSQASKPVRIGVYEFRVGPYGPYMFKTDLKTKKFVSVPKDLDASSLTVKSAEAIYKAGLEAAANKFKRKPTAVAEDDA
jgi:DNA topoisomerase IA